MTRVTTIFFWSGLTLLVSLALYSTSNRVQDLNRQLKTLNAQIEAEQTNIHVLKAEWVYLANPTRIENAARKYLAMHPTAVKQIASLDSLPDILPTREEAMATAAQRNKPIASVASSLPVPLSPEPSAAALSDHALSNHALSNHALPSHADASSTTARQEQRLEGSEDGLHVNTRMNLQKTASVETAYDLGAAKASLHEGEGALRLADGGAASFEASAAALSSVDATP